MVFVDRTFLVWVVLSLVIPFAIGGWTGLLWGGLVRMFFVHHVTWSVNSVCHTFGKRAYETTDRSRNQWTGRAAGDGRGLAQQPPRLPSLGNPRSGPLAARRRGVLIAALERLRLATDVQRIGADILRRKRLAPAAEGA